jgi:hypothetical protein
LGFAKEARIAVGAGRMKEGTGKMVTIACQRTMIPMCTAAMVSHLRPVADANLPGAGSIRTVAVWTLLVMRSFSRFRQVKEG